MPCPIRPGAMRRISGSSPGRNGCLPNCRTAARAEAAAIIQCLQEAMQSGSPTRLAGNGSGSGSHLEELERWAQRDIWDDFDGQ